ncbi:MAG TPA: hypothetical protein VK196_08155 [Magnetospirillum sp.]|nr:hypothetical protein [Magnetospirillum sp.]
MDARVKPAHDENEDESLGTAFFRSLLSAGRSVRDAHGWHAALGLNVLLPPVP